MERTYKLVHGVAYPHLYEGNTQPTEIRAQLGTESRDFYYDDAVRLHGSDVSKFVNKPILEEHDGQKQEVGQIFQTFVDSDGKMRVNARIYTDTPHGRDIYTQIKSGNLKGLSVGYTPVLRGGGSKHVDYKLCDEISICKQPFFDGAHVTVTASKNLDSPEKKIFLHIMATEQKPVEENKDASELLKSTDETAKQMEKQLKEMETMRAELEERRKQDGLVKDLLEKENHRKAELVAQKEKEAQAYLEMQTEQYREAKGDPNATLPQDYVETITTAHKVEEAHQIVDVMASIAANNKRIAEERTKLAAENAELKKQIQMSSDQLNNVARVSASSYNKVTQPVDNSAKAPKLQHLFVPGKMSINESRVYGIDEEDLVRIQASVASKPAAPTHRHMHLVQNSMRQYVPALFDHLVKNGDFGGFQKFKFEVNDLVENPQ